jgi:hypothetical protein
MYKDFEEETREASEKINQSYRTLSEDLSKQLEDTRKEKVRSLSQL